MEDLNNPKSLIKSLNKEGYEKLKSEFKVHDGMIPKLDNAFNVIENGVKAVRICKYNQISKPTNGTILQA